MDIATIGDDSWVKHHFCDSSALERLKQRIVEVVHNRAGDLPDMTVTVHFGIGDEGHGVTYGVAIARRCNPASSLGTTVHDEVLSCMDAFVTPRFRQ